jgi:hypothetical protein
MILHLVKLQGIFHFARINFDQQHFLHLHIIQNCNRKLIFFLKEEESNNGNFVLQRLFINRTIVVQRTILMKQI